MVAQSPPYAEQNAQHTASLFRLATFSAWRDASGIVGPTDLAVTAQATPNMSVQVAAGRAWLRGTQVASVSGGTWSTQGAYFGYNDAPVTLTVAAADPTNPRVDAVVAYVTDSFYNGSTNTFVLGIVTGTPAASPAVPATPSNGLLLGTIAVAANATSIASGNLSAGAGLLLTARGGIAPVLSTDNTAGAFVGQYRDHPTRGLERWDGAQWSTPNPLGQWTQQLTVVTYNWTVAAGTATTLPNFVGANPAQFTVTIPVGRTLEVEFAVPEFFAAASSNAFLRLFDSVGSVTLDSCLLTTGGFAIGIPARLHGTVTGDGASHTISAQGWTTAGSATTQAAGAGGGLLALRYRIV